MSDFVTVVPALTKEKSTTSLLFVDTADRGRVITLLLKSGC